MEARHGAIFGALMACPYGAIAYAHFFHSPCVYCNPEPGYGEHRLATTIPAFTEPGCRNCDDDPHANLKKVVGYPDGSQDFFFLFFFSFFLQNGLPA
jgi:hypothetical protein